MTVSLPHSNVSRKEIVFKIKMVKNNYFFYISPIRGAS